MTTEELKPTKKATRDYCSYSDTPWSLWNVLYGRKSQRKYDLYTPDRKLLESLDRAVDLACRVRGVGRENFSLVTDPGVANELRLAIFNSVQGQINAWLTVSKPSVFLVADIPAVEMSTDRPELLPNLCMAMEDIVLWLMERGLGTCWMGGFNDKNLFKLLGTEEGRRIPLVISVGKPLTGGFNFDSITAQAMSKRRKPLPKIASVEDASKPYNVTDIPKINFSAAEKQGVTDLLESIGNNTGSSCEADPALLIDACLEAARVAPSASNFQPWHLIAVRDGEKLEKLAVACGMEPGWKAAIVAAGKTGKILSRVLERPFWMIDVPISISHMSLMAASMGCPADALISGIDEKTVNRLVKLPDGERAVGVVGLQ